MADFVTSITTVAGLRTWWDSTVPSTVSSGNNYIAELAAGTYDLSTVSASWGGKTVAGTVTIRAAAAARLTSPSRALRYDTDGVLMLMGNIEIYFSAFYTVLEGLQFYSAAPSAGLHLNAYSMLSHCIVAGTILTRADDLYCGAKDCLFVGNRSDALVYASNPIYLEACTLVNFGTGDAFRISSANNVIKNCVFATLAGTAAVNVVSGGVSGSSANNAFNVGTAYGTSSTTFTAASEFVNVVSESVADLQLKSGSSLATVGAAGVGTGTDIYWQARTSSYSLGAFERDAGVADTTLPTQTGIITISAITTTSYTATWPAGADDIAVTGYEYRINAGSWVSVGNVLTTNITGRTPSSTDTFEVRAFDAAANKSTPALSTSVTLADIAVGTITFPAVKDWSTGNLKLNESGVTVIVNNVTTGALVIKLTGKTTLATKGVCTVSDALIIAGTQYRATLILADGSEGTWKYSAT